MDRSRSGKFVLACLRAYLCTYMLYKYVIYACNRISVLTEAYYLVRIKIKIKSIEAEYLEYLYKNVLFYFICVWCLLVCVNVD